MLGLYPYTLIIGHKSYNLLSVIIKLTLQKKLKILQNLVTNDVFLDITIKTQQQQQKKKEKLLPVQGIEPGTSCTQRGCVTSLPPSQLRESIVVNIFLHTQPIYSFHLVVPIWPLFLWWFPISLYYNYALYCKCWEPPILTSGMFTSDRVFPGLPVTPVLYRNDCD